MQYGSHTYGQIEYGGLLVGISAVVTGTITPTSTESDIVSGGKTIIITLTGSTWVTSGAPFDAIRQDIINGLDSAQVEATGWNAVVRDTMSVTAVARTSDTVVTITLPAFASYNITATETITVTVPDSAVDTSGDIIATPTFTVTAAGAGLRVKDVIMSRGIIAFRR